MFDFFPQFLAQYYNNNNNEIYSAAGTSSTTRSSNNKNNNNFLFAAACTNTLVTPGATRDGSAHVAYNSDGQSLYGFMTHLPAADHPPGTMREIYEFTSGRYLGAIPEAAHTYNVIGNQNEHQLVIAETTFDGLPALANQHGAILDYYSLMWVTLQRARTAREAISLMDNLTRTYGYASTGESFSIADPNEVWIMEVIGRGNDITMTAEFDSNTTAGGDGQSGDIVGVGGGVGGGRTGRTPQQKQKHKQKEKQKQLGFVFVAQLIPDGHVCAHANQARIRTWLRDSKTSMWSSDIVDFAVSKGLYPKTSDPLAFSFSDIFDPVTPVGARLCELRVWEIFRRLSHNGETFAAEYIDYVSGANLTHRMPLSVPARSSKKNAAINTNGTLISTSSAPLSSPSAAAAAAATVKKAYGGSENLKSTVAETTTRKKKDLTLLGMGEEEEGRDSAGGGSGDSTYVRGGMSGGGGGGGDLTVNDTMWAMRSHYTDTKFDQRSDVGAGPAHAELRRRPQMWTFNGKRYVNERNVSLSLLILFSPRHFLPSFFLSIYFFLLQISLS